jgi:transcriptional regulator GlxA family with amidase domain
MAATESDGRKGGIFVIAAINQRRETGGMRRVLVVLFDGVQSLDVTGPVEAFTVANRWCESRGAEPGYAIRTASLGGRTVRTTSGLGLVPDADLASVSVPPDLLLVPGGAGARRRAPTSWPSSARPAMS